MSESEEDLRLYSPTETDIQEEQADSLTPLAREEKRKLRKLRKQRTYRARSVDNARRLKERRLGG